MQSRIVDITQNLSYTKLTKTGSQRLRSVHQIRRAQKYVHGRLWYEVDGE